MNNTNQLNILEFCLSPDLGGLELFMVNCFNDFKTKTNTKVIVAPNKKLDNYFEDENKSYLKRNKLFPIFPALKLAKFIDSNDIDIIHFHWTKDIATVVVARVLSKKKPKIVQTRHMTMTRFKDDFYHKWLYKNIDTIHAVTHQVKEQIEKFIPSDIRPRVEAVYLGTKEQSVDSNRVDALREQHRLKDSFVVGIVGRIEEPKGQYIVIDALSQLKHLDMKLLIVGHTMDSAYLNTLKERVKSLELEDRVIFTGFTKEVNEYMHLCDTMVLATKKETFGLVVIEAMMNRCCMIVANSGGPLEIIDDNVNGLFFDRTSDDLALKLEMLYSSSELKESLSEAGYKKAKDKFDLEMQSQKLYELMNSL